MKLQVYSKKAAAEAKDGQLFLRLITADDGDPCLVVVDKDGKKIKNGTLLYYDTRLNCVVLMDDVSRKLPVTLDPFCIPCVLTRRELYAQNKLHSEDSHSDCSSHHVGTFKVENLSDIGKVLEKIAKKASAHFQEDDGA